MDIDEIFKAANADPDGSSSAGGSNDDGQVDDSQIQVKSAEELEREAAAAAAASADDGDGAGASAGNNNGDGDQGGNDNDEYDMEVINTLYQAIAEKTGVDINLDNIKSPEDVIDAIDSIISQKAKPVYASELSEEFDNFIKDGGDPLDFMESFREDLSLPRIETQKDKEDVIRSVLKDAGFSERQIEKKIDSYIESETLDTEAEDALDIIKRRNAKMANDSAKLKKERDEQQMVEQQKLFKSIEDYIDNMKDVRGIPVTKEQVKGLKDYLFKVDKNDNMTGYQRDFNKSIGNLVESAFFTQNKETILRAAQSKGSSDAISKLKSVLKSNKMSGTQGNNRGSVDDSLSPWLKQAAALSRRAA